MNIKTDSQNSRCHPFVGFGVVLLAFLTLPAAIHCQSIDKITFRKLSKLYRSGSPCRNQQGKKNYDHQCAIRMSIALNREGTVQINKKTFSENTCPHGHARGARALARWLRKRTTPRLLQKKDGKLLEQLKKVKGKGIIYLAYCYQRDDGTTGSHIDLWDGNKMRTQPDSLINQATEVWFWKLK